MGELKRVDRLWKDRMARSAGALAPRRVVHRGSGRRAIAALGLGVFAWGCDDTAGTGGGGAASTTSADSSSVSSTAMSSSSTGGPSGSLELDYCAPLAALVCKRATSCGCGAVLPSGVLDEAACTASYTAKCVSAYAPISQAIDAGLARVDAARAAACVGLIEASTPGCERPRGAVPLGLCPAWFTSDVPLGGACAFPICADGAGSCDASGTCVPRPTSGACLGYECAPGSLCLQGQCTQPGDEGANCSEDDACAPPLRCVGGSCGPLGASGTTCVDQTNCAEGLSCPSAACVDAPPTPCSDVAACGNQDVCAHVKKCAMRGQAGAPCARDGACADGLGCDSATSTCALLPSPPAACLNGASCASGSACSLATGLCGPVPGMGEACGLDASGPFVCATGLGCLADNTCGPLPTAGQACAGLNRCADGLGCDFTANGSFCVDKRPVGGDCQNDLVCKAGLHCDFSAGKCATDQALGTPCKDGNECGPSAVCLPGSGGAFVCSPTPTLGQGCQFDCAPDLQCAADPADAFCAAPICLEL
ncbi:MAG: hypothetical protein U0414_12990 [Polyangiaceae bacterium]